MKIYTDRNRKTDYSWRQNKIELPSNPKHDRKCIAPSCGRQAWPNWDVCPQCHTKGWEDHMGEGAEAEHSAGPGWDPDWKS